MTIPLGAATTQTIVADPLNVPDTFGLGVSVAFPWPNDEPVSGFQFQSGPPILASVISFNGETIFSSLDNDLGTNPNSISIDESYWGGVLAFGGSDLCDNGQLVLNCKFCIAGNPVTDFTVTNPHQIGDDVTTTANIGPFNGGFIGFIFTGISGVSSRQYVIDYEAHTIQQAFTGPDNTFPLIWWPVGDQIAVINTQGADTYLTTFEPTALGDPFNFNSVKLDFDDPTITAIVRNRIGTWFDGDNIVFACEYDGAGNPMPNPIIVSLKKDLSSYDTLTLSPGDADTTSVFAGFLAGDYDLDFARSTTDGVVYMAAGPTSGGTIFTAIVGDVPRPPPYIPPPALYRLPCYQVCQPLYIGRK